MRPVLASSRCLFRRRASVAVAYATPLHPRYAPPSPTTLRAVRPKRVIKQLQARTGLSSLRPAVKWARESHADRIFPHLEAALESLPPSKAYGAYRSYITTLFKHRDFIGAAVVFLRLRQADLIPSPALQDTMNLLYAVVHSVPEGEILDLFEAMFQRHLEDRQFHNHLFKILLHTRPFSPQFFCRMHDICENSNVAMYPYRKFQIKSRMKYGSPRYRTESGEMILDPWCQKALDYLKDNHSKLAAHFYPLMNTRSYHRSAVLVLGNLHIQAKAMRLRYDQIFEMYEALSRVPRFTPNSRTFDLLFRGLRMAAQPRSFKYRQVHVRSGDLPSPRDLFREMLYFHAKVTEANARTDPIDKQPYRPRVLTPSSIRAAIETFLQTRDYVAVYVALRTCSIYNIPLETPIYRLIVHHLASRTYDALSDNAGGPWARAFLGPETFLLDDPIDIVQQVLELGLPTERSSQEQTAEMMTMTMPLRETSARTAKKPQPPVMPSARTILRLRDDAGQSWVNVPLERIVRRAMLATRLASTFGENEKSEIPPAKYVSKAIVRAKLEMLPTEIRNLHSP